MIIVSIGITGLSQVHFKFNPGDEKTHVTRMAISEKDTQALLETVKTQIEGIISG
jgi:hypothetical protein